SNNKIYSFFIIIALLFWNPVSYFLIYSNTPIYSIKELHILHWVIFISGILLIFLIQRNIFNAVIKNIIFAITVIGILFSCCVLFDRAIGLVSKNETVQYEKSQWLIFEPYSKARYHTFEFDFVANINSLGLRDHEIEIDKGDRYRILCFGDSWTYGYGVNAENSWPKKLEQYLSTNDVKNVEVINCGRPGQFTGTYKEYTKEIVPLLKPDIVLVGVLQLDDLAQLYTNNFTINHSGVIATFFRKSTSVLLRYFKYSFMNIFPPSRMIEVTANWDKITASKISKYNNWQKLRFSTLDYSVQVLFKNGNIEPSLLEYYINYPDRITIFNNPEHPATKFAVNEMKKDINEMKEVCRNNNSNLIFINIPINYFTGHQVIQSPSDILNPYFKNNNKIDSIYRSIANFNDIPYIELTDHFSNLQDKTAYLFKYDGHPNEKGYAEIANYVGEQLIVNGYTVQK
ncbi:SGNH/GDSL hydrolase family protein, partial [bacterium]|nr:SGNH/GDSL hydrolase family protein [bacterium]